MKKKNVVKLMIIVLVGLMIILGVVIGMKKVKSGDSKESEANTEEVFVPEDDFEDDPQKEVISEPIKSDRIDDDSNNEYSTEEGVATEESNMEESNMSEADGGRDFEGIVLPDDPEGFE